MVFPQISVSACARHIKRRERDTLIYINCIQCIEMNEFDVKWKQKQCRPFECVGFGEVINIHKLKYIRAIDSTTHAQIENLL